MSDFGTSSFEKILTKGVLPMTVDTERWLLPELNYPKL
jgi:hypothetical protein